MREVIDTDRCLTVCDTAELCDLKRTALQCISKVDVLTLAVYSGRRRKVLKRIEKFKSSNISTFHCNVKSRRSCSAYVRPDVSLIMKIFDSNFLFR